MKLNNSTKKTKSLLKLFSILCLVAFTICANSEAFRRTSEKRGSSNVSKVSSKSELLPDKFESILTIITGTGTGKTSSTKTHNVILTKDYLSTPLSGFKFVMKDDNEKINCPVISPAATGGYFIKYQFFTKEIECQNSGWFDGNSVTYFLNDGKESYTISFTFPKRRFYFGDTVKNDDLRFLCYKIAYNYINYKSELSKKITEVTNFLSSAKNLEIDLAKNMKERADFEQAASKKIEDKKILLDQLNSLNANKKEYIDQIKKIEESKTDKQKEYENLLLDIIGQEQVLKNLFSIIKDKTENSQNFKLISDKEIQERYDAVKAALSDYSTIYFPKDPFFVNTLSPLLANVKVNKNGIIPALRMN